MILICLNNKLNSWIKKNDVKVMDQNSAGFMYVKNNFPRISGAKIK